MKIFARVLKKPIMKQGKKGYTAKNIAVAFIQ